MTAEESMLRKHNSFDTNPWAWIDGELEEVAARKLLRRIGTRRGAQSATIEFDGHQVINFASNDYLAIASDPRIAAAVGSAIERSGWGSGASPLVAGFGALHVQLQAELAAFEQAEGALLFPTGYAANVAVITALADASTVIFSDSKNHASIIDGCRLAEGRTEVYRHGDVDDLSRCLCQNRAAPRKLIVTDGLFSMDGDLAPIDHLVALANKHGAMLVVDEAHATGVFGHGGKGVCEQFDRCAADCLVRVGTLSKALGSLGGFVAGPAKVIEWLTNRGRTLIFSTAAPEAMCAASLAALEIVRTEPHRRRDLLMRSCWLRDAFRSRGLNVGKSASQIVPVILGDAERTMVVSRKLWDAGFYIPGIRPPSVPPGESLLRVSLRSDHTPAMLESLVDGMTKLVR